MSFMCDIETATCSITSTTLPSYPNYPYNPTYPTTNPPLFPTYPLSPGGWYPGTYPTATPWYPTTNPTYYPSTGTSSTFTFDPDLLAPLSYRLLKKIYDCDKDNLFGLQDMLKTLKQASLDVIISESDKCAEHIITKSDPEKSELAQLLIKILPKCEIVVLLSKVEATTAAYFAALLRQK